MARVLAEQAPEWVLRIPTDDRPVAEIAAEIITAIGWLPAP